MMKKELSENLKHQWLCSYENQKFFALRHGVSYSETAKELSSTLIYVILDYISSAQRKMFSQDMIMSHRIVW